MEHALQPVDLVDEKGAIVGTKLRRDIRKGVDSYHSVYVLLLTPEKKFVLSKIPKRVDLPNQYVGQLGATVATIRRHDETVGNAAVRVLIKELFCDNPQPVHLGDHYEIFDDGHGRYGRYMSAYFFVDSLPQKFSKVDIESFHLFSKPGLARELAMHEEKFTPTLKAIWQRYSKALLQI